jgi:hypothetical protein
MAAAMRERETPYVEANPGGILDFRSLANEQLPDRRSARVSGFGWEPRPYSVKLEGVAKSGFRTIIIAGFADRDNIANYEALLLSAREKAVRHLNLSPDDFAIDFISYGRDGVLGSRSPFARAQPPEVGLVVDIVAASQALATSIARLVRSTLLHTGYEGRRSTEGNVAFPFAPTEIEVGPVYRWSIWHALPTDDPVEPFAIRVDTYGPR